MPPLTVRAIKRGLNIVSKFTKITRGIRKLFGADVRDYFNSAIIVAGGTGSRMNLPEGQTKQLLDVSGLPVIVRTVNAFEACPDIDEIILVVRKDEFPVYKEYMRTYKFKKVTHIVSGGDTRQQSVLNGLSKVNERAEFVSIHDGARCLITPGQISEVCTWAYHYGAATAAVAATDSVKLSEGGFIKETLDRNNIYLVGTPQIFKHDLYRAAAYSAKKDGFEATDDNSLVERLKVRIYLTDIGRDNIKITNIEDISKAEEILKRRESL